MLSRAAALASVSALKSAAPVSVLPVFRNLHTSHQSKAPVPALPEKGGKVRYGFVPEEFFQFLYPKTGVTGPYMFGTGLLVYLLSKEIYVLNYETISGLSVGIVILYAIKTYGKTVAEFADKLNMAKVAEIQEVKDATMNNLMQSIDNEKKEQWRVEGRNYLFDAKRNNVTMLLEANYRERIHQVHTGVKKRMDYQIGLQHLKQRLGQEYMVNWVEKSIIQSLTPQQDKESIAKCISDLKALSKTAQARV
uniref:ATP synthase subunit b n=1 Tax=Callorhinchus milii TaxID=7868 RepID=K4GCL2_CALMI|nr:ATP synthase, H+ transporting, mitochondrial Fo complex, subunit B1 [Callorhinchus milii]AFM86903.1 ATP synthase, H+ transporting, mitochondrial Fo complex, subunit B1 [Callorhinchus milii]